MERGSIFVTYCFRSSINTLFLLAHVIWMRYILFEIGYLIVIVSQKKWIVCLKNNQLISGACALPVHICAHLYTSGDTASNGHYQVYAKMPKFHLFYLNLTEN